MSSTLLLRLVQQQRLPAPSASLASFLDGLDVALSQLLSGSAGLLHDGARGPCKGAKLQECVEDILEAGVANASQPSNGAAGLALAAWAAEQATGQTWASLFEDFQAESGMGAEAEYSQWAPTNPWLAGGLTATPRGYASFLHSLLNGTLLEPALRELQWQDWATTAVSKQAHQDGLGDWHAGLGVVLECESSQWDQCSSDRITVSGASRLGFYPFISRTPRLHFGLIARDAEVDYFNKQHARVMTILGATCLLLGVAGAALSYCWMKRQKKAMKKKLKEIELTTQP